MLPMELLISRLHSNGLNQKINLEQKKTSPLYKVLHYPGLPLSFKVYTKVFQSFNYGLMIEP